MYELFVYDLVKRDYPARRIAVVFCPFLGLSEEDLFAGLRQHFNTAVPPDVIVLLGTSAQELAFLGFRSSKTLRDGLPGITRYVSTPEIVGVCLYNDGLRFADERDAHVLDLEVLRDDIRQRGLMHIFNLRRGILESGGSFHYVKPSQKHSDKFIRTANVLIRGAEVHFIAFWLLPHLDGTVRYIYTDTAAINSVGQALIALAHQYDDSFKCATVDSFSSYDGLKRFRFDGTDNCLVLVSASTSGDLEGKLRDQHQIPPSHIWTLFYLGPEPDRRVNILCKLNRHDVSNPDGYTEIESYPAADCPLCRQGLTPIEIAGDQFLPEGAKVSDYRITVRDRPLWLNDFCADFSGRQLIRANVASLTNINQPRELFINLKEVYSSHLPSTPSQATSDMAFLARLDDIIRQSVSFNVNRIVYLDDESSPALAERVVALFRASGSSTKVALISAETIMHDLDAHVATDGTTLVVAGATVTGRHLLAISQALRHIQKNRLIQYLIGVARCQSADRFKDLKRDLQFGERGLDHYDLRCASEVWLPDDAPNRIQPWAEEREMLLKAKERVLEDIGATELIETRLATLDDSAAGGGPGLIDDLFWPSSATNLAMKLRPNFAFWRFDYVDKASQADVYFTIASILHYRRSGSGTRMGLTDNDHHRVLLSPRSFDQFNDGVIQASLLRASHRSELNYSVDVERSRMMTDTLAFFLQNMRNQAGEAATEFLIALFNDKLKLGFSDHRNLLNMMRNLTHIDGINRVLRDILCTV